MKFLTIPVLALILFSRQNGPTALIQRKDVIDIEKKDMLKSYSDALKRKDVGWFRKIWANEKEFALELNDDLITDHESWFEKTIPGSSIQIYKIHDVSI